MGSTPWIGINLILTWMLVMLLNFSQVQTQEQPVDFDSCSSDCTVRPNLSCVVQEGCANRVFPKLSESGKVHDLRGMIYTDRNRPDRPYLNLTWKVPELGTEKVRGFLIKVTQASRSVADYCRKLVFSPGAQLTTSDKGELWYHSGCIPLDWEKNYAVYVQNLPLGRLESEEWPHLEILTKASNSPVNCRSSAECPTEITVTPDAAAGQLTVSFPQAPLEVGIIEYKISLSNPEYPENITETIIRPSILQSKRIERHVYNLCIPGTWIIFVSPHQLQDWSCASSTVCKNEAGVCTKCDRSKTETNFQPEKPCVEKMPVDHQTKAQMWAVILGICAGCLLTSIFVAVIIYKSSFCASPNSRGPRRRSSAPRYLVDSMETERSTAAGARVPRKQVLMLYSDDNDHHKKAVKHLASLLDNHCECDVIMDDFNQEQVQKDHLAWLMKFLDTSQKIILVHSEGAFKKYHAKRSGDPYRSLSARKADLFTPAVEMLIKERSQGGFSFKSAQNTVSVFLPYTPREYVIKEASPSFNYSLMTDMDSLVYHIHNLPRDEPKAKSMAEKVNLANYRFLPEGKRLLAAIADNRKFLEDNPHWFEKEYVRMTMEGNADSGRGTLQESIKSGILNHPKPKTDPEPYSQPNNFDGHVYAELPEPWEIGLTPNKTEEISHASPRQCEREQKTLPREGSVVARLRQSFEASADSDLNITRDNVRNKYRKNKGQSTTSSQGKNLELLSEAEEPYSIPLPKSQRSSRDISATSDFGGELPSRPSSYAPSNDHLYDKRRSANTSRNTNNRSLKGSIKDYSAFVDDAFAEALYGQSMGEPWS